MPKPIFRAIAITGFILFSLAALPGCLISSTSQTKTTGASVAPATFDQIRPGATTIGWVRATLGDPTSKSVAGNDEVWKYTYTERTDSAGAVFLVFGGSSTSEKSYTTFIEFKDGIVTNKWRG